MVSGQGVGGLKDYRTPASLNHFILSSDPGNKQASVL